MKTEVRNETIKNNVSIFFNDPLYVALIYDDNDKLFLWMVDRRKVLSSFPAKIIIGDFQAGFHRHTYLEPLLKLC